MPIAPCPESSSDSSRFGTPSSRSIRSTPNKTQRQRNTVAGIATDRIAISASCFLVAMMGLPWGKLAMWRGSIQQNRRCCHAIRGWTTLDSLSVSNYICGGIFRSSPEAVQRESIDGPWQRESRAQRAQRTDPGDPDRCRARRGGLCRFQPPLRQSRPRTGAGDRPPVRRGHTGNLHRVQCARKRRADRQPRRRRGGVAYRHVLSRRAADGEHALCPRGAGQRRQHVVLPHVCGLWGAAGGVEAPDRAPQDQARRHLQQRRLSAPGCCRDRRSAELTRGRASPGLHPSRHRAAHAVSRPPAQCLSDGTRTCRIRSAARSSLGLRRESGVRMGARLARWRSRAVGQSLHHASTRSVRRLGTARHASHPDQGQREPGLMRRLSVSNTVLLIICIMYLILYVDRVNISTAAPLIKADLKLSNTELGLAFSAFAYPYALFQLIGGYSGDKFGARLTLCGSGLIVCAATAATGAVGGLASLFVARLALGIGEGATFPTATRAMAVWTPERSWGFAQGITHAFARLGNAVTPPLL